MKHLDIAIGPYFNNVKEYPIQTKRHVWTGQKRYALQSIYLLLKVNILIQLFIITIRNKYFMKPTDIRMELNICVVQKIVCQGCLQFWCWSKSINSLQTKRLKTQITMNEYLSFLFCELSLLPLNIWTHFSCLNEHFAFMGLNIYLNRKIGLHITFRMGSKFQHFHK